MGPLRDHKPLVRKDDHMYQVCVKHLIILHSPLLVISSHVYLSRQTKTVTLIREDVFFQYSNQFMYTSIMNNLCMYNFFCKRDKIPSIPTAT